MSDVKPCAARFGCDEPREDGKLFCRFHLRAEDREACRGPITQEQLEYMMTRDRVLGGPDE